ncbi:hypothetical protein GCM10007362_25020 [Saccharibacillus endophyticus]|uniref:Uncharacterized protein n=1 Tax=Saccharibacillus endophyticus TaxID=2060666 RepID=A0ABQ1ZTH3_9BACL|nr:hypothetical protein GCM10007362_25020 [Saccharibacillus endophyticus]
MFNALMGGGPLEHAEELVRSLTARFNPRRRDVAVFISDHKEVVQDGDDRLFEKGTGGAVGRVDPKNGDVGRVRIR